MPSALITGATGFIGQHLVRSLVERGWNVRVWVRPESTSRVGFPPQASVVRCGITEPAFAGGVAEVDYVFHLAGATVALTSADFDRANADVVKKVASACALAPHPPVLVLVSSVAAAGPVSRGSVRLVEDRELPVSAYGRSKLAGEEAVRLIAEKVPTTIVRPGIVFGPGDQASLKIFRAIQRSGFHAYPRWRTPPISVVYIDDLIETLVVAAERGERLPATAPTERIRGQGIYFACRDEYPTYQEFGWLAAQALGRRWYVPLPLPRPIPFVVGGGGELLGRLRGRPFVLNLDKFREATASSWACSPEKTAAQLGISPSAPLLEQMKTTVAWYRSVGWL